MIYFTDPDLVFTHYHGLSVMEDRGMDSHVSRAELHRGRMFIPHLPTHQQAVDPKLVLHFGHVADQAGPLSEALADIPYAVKPSQELGGYDVIIEGGCNIRRAIGALFEAAHNDTDPPQRPLISRRMHDALAYEHEGQEMTTRYYVPDGVK